MQLDLQMGLQRCRATAGAIKLITSRSTHYGLPNMPCTLDHSRGLRP